MFLRGHSLLMAARFTEGGGAAAAKRFKQAIRKK
jgi:hypothetical protein